MTSPDASSYLDSFLNYEKNLNEYAPAVIRLERMFELLSRLGDPHKGLECIHIAGSKGKGSTCAMLGAVLKHAGFRVGLYTSPHLYSVRERIRVLGAGTGGVSSDLFEDCIPSEELFSILDEIKPQLESLRQTKAFGFLTFFEVITALAFIYFKKKYVELVVLETGLGGRYDATNVVEARLNGITPISLEHTRQLGNTLALIAAEKAAIIKSSASAAVSAEQAVEVGDVIQQACLEKQVRLVRIGQDLKANIRSIHLDGQDIEVCSRKNAQGYHFKSLLLGPHQAQNWAMAIGLAEEIIPESECLRQSVVQAAGSLFWPGRFEIFGKHRIVVLDGAHNADSGQKLAETFGKVFPGRTASLVLGMLGDKDHEGFCRAVSKVVRTVIVTRVDHPRASVLSDEKLANFFPSYSIKRAEGTLEALGILLSQSQEGEIILVSGSLFLVAEARRLLQCQEIRCFL